MPERSGSFQVSFSATEKFQLQFYAHSYSCKRKLQIQMWIKSSKRKVKIQNNCFRRKLYSVWGHLAQVSVGRRWLCCRPVVTSSGEKQDSSPVTGTLRFLVCFDPFIKWLSLRVCYQNCPGHLLWGKSLILDWLWFFLIKASDAQEHSQWHDLLSCARWCLFCSGFFWCDAGFACPVHFWIKITWWCMLVQWVERSVFVKHF